MANELQTKLDAILEDKNTNLLPEHLKAGVTCLGVEGEFEGGAGQVKLFNTIEEMQNDANPNEGDLALIYREEIQNATANSQFSQAKFPATVVLPEALTDYIDVMYRAVDNNIMFDCWGELNSSMFQMSIYTEEGSVRIQYESTDGITYTRTDGGDEIIDFGTLICYPYVEMWNDAIGYFIQAGRMYFGGLYEYQSYIDKEDVYTVLLSDVPFNFDSTNGITNMTWTGNKYRLLNVPTIQEIADKINTETGEYASYFAIDENDNIVLFKTKGTNYGVGDIAFDMNKNLLGVCFPNSSNAQPALTVHTLDLDNKSYTTKELSISGNIYVTSPSYKYNWSYYPLKLKTIVYRISESGMAGSNNYFVVGDTTKGFRTSYTGGGGVIAEDLKGLFLEEYDYFMAPTQLTLTSKNELLPGKIAYGKNGIVEGDDSVYDNIGIAKPLSAVTGIDIDTKDVLLEPMKKAIMPKGNGLVLTEGNTNYLYCRRLLPEVDMTDMNQVIINSNRLLGVIKDSTANTITFKSYNLNTGEMKIENTYTFTSISNVTLMINQATDELGYIVLADRTSSKFIIYKLENDIATEVINTTLTCESMYTSGVDLNLLFGNDNHLYIGIIRPTKTAYVYKLVDTSLVEVTHVALHSSFDYHNDIYCLRTGDHLYFGYFRTWSFTSDMNHKIIHINTATGNANIITSTYKENRMDSAKLHYDNENMYIVNNLITIKVSPTSVTTSNLLKYSSVNADYYYYDSATNTSTVQYGPYKGSWMDNTTGTHKESSFGFSLSNPSENSDSISIVDRTFLNNPNDACFYMRHKNIIAEGFVCYWLNNKSFIEDSNNVSPYIRISDTAMIKLGHINPKVINYEDSISPTEKHISELEHTDDLLLQYLNTYEVNGDGEQLTEGNIALYGNAIKSGGANDAYDIVLEGESAALSDISLSTMNEFTVEYVATWYSSANNGYPFAHGNFGNGFGIAFQDFDSSVLRFFNAGNEVQINNWELEKKTVYTFVRTSDSRDISLYIDGEYLATLEPLWVDYTPLHITFNNEEHYSINPINQKIHACRVLTTALSAEEIQSRAAFYLNPGTPGNPDLDEPRQE